MNRNKWNEIEQQKSERPMTDERLNLYKWLFYEKTLFRNSNHPTAKYAVQYWKGVKSVDVPGDGWATTSTLEPKNPCGDVAVSQRDGAGILVGFATEAEADEFAKETDGFIYELINVDDAHFAHEIAQTIKFAGWNRMAIKEAFTFRYKEAEAKELSNWMAELTLKQLMTMLSNFAELDTCEHELMELISL